MTTVRIYDTRQSKMLNVVRIEKSDADWNKLLTQKQYEITTEKGTEAPGSCTLDQVHEPGIFGCVCCDTDIVLSATKFEAGTGWPGFHELVSPLNVVEQPDRRLGIVRAEVLCGRSGSHLGHVFDDGLLPTGKRYCINGCALRFMPEGK